ncbi:MAG: FMN-binding protein [Oscillospiraceae bacterium]
MGTKKLSKIQIFRRAVQVAAFLLLPGLFISVFSAFKDVYMAIIGGSFSFSALSGQLLILLAVIPITVLMGRFFCGFLCAFGSMGDLLWFVSGKISKKRLKVSEKADGILKLVKYIILLLIAVFIWTLGFSIDSTSNPWTIFGMYASVSGWPPAGYLLSVGAALLLVIIVGSMFIERFFCRYLCPLGAIFAITSSVRLFRIKKPRENCGKCRLCALKCAMGIPLYKTDTVTSGECIDCFACVAACPRGNVKANPTPAVASAMSVAAIAGLYYVGSLVPQNSSAVSGTSSAVTDSASQGQFTDGVYTGSASGYRGTTEVQVTVESGNISDIEVLSTGDDSEFFNRAEYAVISSILTLQSTEVDTVSGATFSSRAIINAVIDALGITSTGGESVQTETSTTSDAASGPEDSAVSKNTHVQKGKAAGGISAPKGSAASEETTAPANSAASEETTAPADSAASEETTAPADSAASEETTAPADSAASEETTAPADSAASEETTAPADGAASEETTAPADSAASEETAAPADGAASNSEGIFTDGIYSGTGMGFRGDVNVTVTVTDGKIADITIESHQDDYKYFNYAKNTIISSIITEQSVNVDTVSGATFSSNGIIGAVADALGL